jgi:uncharacterized membrane protein (UPF0127 family)
MVSARKKFSLIAVALIMVLFFILKFWQQYHFDEAYIQVADETLNILVAKNPYQWRLGLGKRDSMEGFQGMLLAYPEKDRHGIVMRNMKFPLDVIWISDGVIIDMAQNIPVENLAEESLKQYYPRKECNAVLELSSGWAGEHGLKIGDKVFLLNQ